jgi:hypothetical protein
MGIETVIAIAGLAIAAGGTAAEVKTSQDAKAAAKDTQHEQEAAVRDQNAQLASEQAKNDATLAAKSARMRQRALLAGSQGSASTIATSPLGLAPAGANGTQPLKTNLGA